LLLPQEVVRMSADMELVFRDTAPPFLLRRLKWFLVQPMAATKDGVDSGRAGLTSRRQSLHPVRR
jgi:type IV secretory pathway TraG/TraD family ATPase VirD4